VRQALSRRGTALVTLVFLHGVGGAARRERWVDPLNARLAELGFPQIQEASGDKMCVPAYQVAKFEGATEPPITYQPSKDEAFLREELDFAARQKELERFIRPYGDKCGPGLRPFPDFVVNPIAEAVEFLGFPEVVCYMGDRSARYSAWSQVLKQLPQDGPVIAVAHSLGSVVMADLLHRLPEGLTLDLLVTIGSPLAFNRYRSNARLTKGLFPYGKVKRWLNVAAPMDGVCGGRGLSSAVPQVIDVHADLSFTHAAAGYMSHSAVAAAIGYVTFRGAPRPSSSEPHVPSSPARRIHDSWDPLLLGTAFSLQVSNCLPKNRWAEKARLDMARQEFAKRALHDIAAQRRARQEHLTELHAIGADVADVSLDDHPLADGRFPDHDSLTYGAASILCGKWRDEDLLASAVGLMLLPVVPPFDIRVTPEARQAALESTMNVIRNRRGNLADKAFAQQVGESLKWAESRMAGGGFPWGTAGPRQSRRIGM
jgi:pimeloyl-ACP methyl ester carboxylesterase